MDGTNLPPEQQLLLCIARRNLDPETALRLRDLVTSPFDWEHLREIAAEHRLLPLLALHVTSHCADLVPSEVLQTLRTALFENRESNLYLILELVRVLKRFKSAGIEALSFKGPVLGQIAYEDIGLRQAGDLDILIQPKDFHRAAEVLRELAYTMEPQLTRAQQKSHLRFHCEIQFMKEDHFSVVDLHWGITPKTFPLALTANDFLSNRKTVHLAGHSIETLTDEDLIFYLSVHAAKHCFRKLEWIATLAELVRRDSQLSWATVKQRAVNAKAERIVCLALMTVESLYGLSAPKEFAALAGSTELQQTAGNILQFLLANNAEPHGLRAFRWRQRFLPARDAYVSLIRAMLVPTISDWRAITLPDSLYPIYYLLRPLRLMTKYGRGTEE
jgi:Uncharacterised nucleotidyltransferase